MNDEVKASCFLFIFHRSSFIVSTSSFALFMKFTRSVLSLAFVAAFGLVLFVPAGAAHKFHTSFTEAEYNAPEHSLQITLRTFPDDLENVLSRRAGKPVRLDQKKEMETLLVAYLQETFQLKNAKGEAVKLSWVGMDAGVDSAWL